MYGVNKQPALRAYSLVPCPGLQHHTGRQPAHAQDAAPSPSFMGMAGGENVAASHTKGHAQDAAPSPSFMGMAGGEGVAASHTKGHAQDAAPSPSFMGMAGNRTPCSSTEDPPTPSFTGTSSPPQQRAPVFTEQGITHTDRCAAHAAPAPVPSSQAAPPTPSCADSISFLIRSSPFPQLRQDAAAGGEGEGTPVLKGGTAQR